MKKHYSLFLFGILLCVCASLLLLFAGCQNTPDTTDTSEPEITLTFSGSSWTCSDKTAVSVDKTNFALVILKPGIYHVSGELTDGQLKVAVNKSEKVTLILEGFKAASSVNAPLYVESAEKVKIQLAAGTVNELTDAKNYHFTGTETKPNACLYSSDDLTISGEGELIIHGNYNNGIGCKNDLKIKSGKITIDCIKNAVKGNDSVTIEGGTLTVTAAMDAIKTDSEALDGGFIEITGGTLSLTCEDDALQATQAIVISAGTVTVQAGGKSLNCDGKVTVADGCLIEK